MGVVIFALAAPSTARAETCPCAPADTRCILACLKIQESLGSSDIGQLGAHAGTLENGQAQADLKSIERVFRWIAVDPGKVSSSSARTSSAARSSEDDTIDNGVTVSGSQIQEIMSDLGPRIDEFSRIVNESIGRTLDIADRLTKPGGVFMLTAAGSAGAVVGGAVARLAMDFVGKEISVLGKLISGAYKREKIAKQAEAFSNARKAYEATAIESARIESSLKSMLSLLKNHRLTGVPEETVTDAVSNDVEFFQAKYRVLTEDLEKSIADRADQARQKELAAQAASTKAWLRALETIQTHFPNGNENAICDRMDKLFSKADEIEAVLQESRIQMLAAEKEWRQGKYANYRRRMRKLLDEAIRETASREKADTKGIARLAEFGSKTEKQVASAIVSDCMPLFPSYKEGRRICAALVATKDFPTLRAVATQVPAKVKNHVRYAKLEIEKRIEELQLMRKYGATALADLIDAAEGNHRSGTRPVVIQFTVIARELEANLRFMSEIRENQKFFLKAGWEKLREDKQAFCAARG
jgi:hypothetical protein